MAFATAQARITAVERAASVLGTLRTIYFHSQQLQAMLQLYQAGTDPTLNAAFNALFTVADRQELATMIGQLQALAVDWETNHASVLA